MPLIRYLLHILLVRPFMRGIIGLNIHGAEGLPKSGPAVIIANHNSHLDTLLLMSLLPPQLVNRIRPVAAEDYFFRNRFLAWCVTGFLGVIPIRRGNFRTSQGDPLAECSKALERKEILLVFPEGTRGEPGKLSRFKTGICHLAKRNPDTVIYPVFINGLETVLPRGSYIPVPLVCNVYVGRSRRWKGERNILMKNIIYEMTYLQNRALSRCDHGMRLGFTSMINPAGKSPAA